MNWKEHGHLFCNGSFLMRSKDYDIHRKIFQYMPFNVIGWDESKKEFLVSQNNGSWKHIDDCTLIARKIEDMSDDEGREIIMIKNKWEMTTELNPDLSPKYKFDWSNNRDVFIYLLSIGVYPFDQSHFETGTVIDIKTL